jgi:hypothetical protein
MIEIMKIKTKLDDADLYLSILNLSPKTQNGTSYDSKQKHIAEVAALTVREISIN